MLTGREEIIGRRLIGELVQEVFYIYRRHPILRIFPFPHIIVNIANEHGQFESEEVKAFPRPPLALIVDFALP